MAIKDPVLIEARRLKKEDSLEKAAQYLADEASKYTVNDDLFFKYFLKCIEYMKQGPLSEYQKTIENNFNQLFDVMTKNKLFNNNYKNVCDSEFHYYIHKGDGNNAMVSCCRLSQLTCRPEFRSSYILLIKEMADKAWRASQLFNTSQQKKDSEYIFYFLKSQLLDIGWHLSVDVKCNMERYALRNLKWFENVFRQFEIFNNMRWDIDGYDDLEEYLSEETANVFKRYCPNMTTRDIVLKLYDLLFHEFPVRLGFHMHYLEPDFNDLLEFGEHFSSIYNNSEAYNTKIAITADDMANEFLEQLHQHA